MHRHGPNLGARVHARTIAIWIFALALAGCSGSSTSTPTAAIAPAGPTGTTEPQHSVSLATAAPPTTSPTTSPTTFVPEAGRIAYAVKGADGSVQLASANADGSNVHQLTTGAGFHACATYSPDRTQIAFCSDASGNFEVWTVGSDGTRQAQLTHLGGKALFPNYSPDGRFIAVGAIEGTDTHSEIDLVDATTGGSLQTLTSCAGQKAGCSNAYPAWSPDGKHIVYIHADDTDASGSPIAAQVWVMDANGAHAHALTTSAALKDELPEWSPDGSQIVYQSGSGGNGGIWLMDSNGSNARQLTGCKGADPSPCAAGDDFGPAWSPDGSQIAFVRDFSALGGNDRPVFLMHADGSNQHRLLPDHLLQYVPAW